MPSRVSKSSSLLKSNRTPLSNQVTLERVLGFTLSNNCALSLDRNSGQIAYIAGCVVVIRQLTGDQQHFIQSSSKKPLTAVEFSPDGKFIATGESGHQPLVRLWSVSDGSQLAEYAGHHFRVVAVRFSPSTRYLVSLGSQEDNTLYVWDRASGQRVASAKVTNKVNGIAFSPTGQFFVTVGVRHVRYWYLEPRRNRHKETLPVNGRNAILGDLLNNTFTDVCCTLRIPDPTLGDRANETGVSEDGVTGTVLTLVVSKAGQLMQFNDQRYLEKWVELRTSRASCLSTSGPWVIVGCARGTCLLFESETLQFLARLPLPHSLGSDLQPRKLGPIYTPATPTSDEMDASIHPDLLAIKLDWPRSRVVCCHADHSFYVWDIADLNNIRCRTSNFYHSRGVWSIDCFVDNSNASSIGSTLRVGDSTQTHAPSWWTGSTFVTCADDGTIRFWSLDDESSMDGIESSVVGLQDSFGPVVEKLLRIIYTDPGHKFLCVTDRPSVELTYPKFEAGVGPVGGPPSSSAPSSVAANDSALPSPSSPTLPTVGDFSMPPPSNGCCVRTVCISPDCRHLAVGDRDGNLRVYALETLTAICHIPAHDSEILSLSFFRSDSVPELALLCSASRDRLIHIFDPNQNYSLVQTVADHSAAIFAARIVETEEDGEIRLISCGMDKSLLIRVLEPDDAGLTAHFALEHHLVGRHSQLDAAFTPNLSPFTDSAKATQRRRYLAVACQDRRLRIYNVTTGRPVRCYRGSFNEDGCLIRCTIDPTGSVVATSGSDKQLNLFHLLTGESIATLCGHAELALGLRFLPDLRRLVSVSSDSCIFVWRLAPNLTQHMCTRTTLTRRTQSFTGFPSSVGTATAPLRWPRPIRGAQATDTGEEDGEDDTTSWTNDSPVHTRQSQSVRSICTPRTALCDEDSEADLSNLDTEELLPHDALPRGGSGDVLDTSDVELRVSNDSFSSYQTANSTRPSGSSRDPTQPTFYFSVSALPAWARRKLSRRSSLALGPSSIPKLAHGNTKVTSEHQMTDIPSAPSNLPTTGSPPLNRRSAQMLTGTSTVTDERCSSDSLNSSRVGSRHASPHADHVMSQSDYGICTGHSTEQPRVIDSRNLQARASRQTDSTYTTSSCGTSVISAPTTPFRRNRSMIESHFEHRTVRQPKRHTVSVASGLQQHGPSFAYNTGSLRIRGSRVVHESISEMYNPKKVTDDERETAEEHASGMFEEPNTRHPIPSGSTSTPWTSGQSFFPPSIHAAPSKPRDNQSSTENELVRSSSPSCSTQPHDRPTSLVVVPSADQRTRSDHLAVNDQLRSTTNRFTTDIKNMSSGNKSPGSSSLSSDPASESTSKTPRSLVPNSQETRRGLSKNSFTAPTFASRQRATTCDLIGSGKPTTARTNQVRSHLKKAVSTISVERSGLGGSSAESRANDDRSQCETVASPIGDNPAPRSMSTTRSSTHSLGRAVSHMLLTSPTNSHRSPLSARARWVPESNSSRRIGAGSIGTPGVTTTTKSKPQMHTPTSLAVVRPSELSLARIPVIESEPMRPNQQQSSIQSATNGPIKSNDDSLGSDSTQVAYKFQESIRADSSSHSTLAECDKFRATRDALEAVLESLDLAVKRCSEYKTTEHGSEESNLTALRTLVTNELEWRFAQLRAMLDLSPICVDPPVARVLLADLVERLIPKLQAHTSSDRTDSMPHTVKTKSTVDRQASLTQWIADSTTEPAPPTPAEESNKVVSDEHPPREGYSCDLIRQPTSFTDRVSWTLDARAVVSEET